MDLGICVSPQTFQVLVLLVGLPCVCRKCLFAIVSKQLAYWP